MREKPIYVNTRSISAGLTGVQRYTIEIVARLGEGIECITPVKHARGARGHLWEQLELPRLVSDALLWSPANTGPIRVRRQVVTIHDLSALDHPEWFTPAFARWYAFLVPRLCRGAAAVITDSEFTRTRVIERLEVPEERVTVIYPGVDERFRAADDQKVLRVRQALGMPSGPYLLSLSSLEPRKNIPRLLEAWKIALPSLPPDAVLVLAGAPGGRRVFKELLVGELPPRVVMVGRVADDHLPALFSGALAFLYPSIYEGFGLPPLEAMASGTPVIAGNRTSLPEVLGDAATLVDPEDTDALAASMAELVRNESRRRSLAESGMRHARQFTWQAAAGSVRRVLEQHR